MTAHLAGSFSWLVRRSDPPKLPVSASLSLINPLVPAGRHAEDDSILSVDDDWYVVSESLRFLSTDAQYMDGDGSHFVLQMLPRFLKSLRVDTADPYQATMVRGEEVEVLGLRRLPARNLETRYPVHRIFLPRPPALRIAKAFRRTARFLSQASPPDYPVFAELALDAIQAQETDPRKSILFSAFAVEQMAETQLEAAYDRAKAGFPGRGNWQWVERQSSKDEAVRKDPIFERLMRASRASYDVLLVELPLYSLGKSLLDDDKTLYDLVRRLQATRNSLTHEGLPHPDETLLTLDSAGASLALRIASAAFRWFGEINYFYSLPLPGDPELDLHALFAESPEELTKPPKGPLSWRYTPQ